MTDTATEPTKPLKIADASAKPEMLALIEELRAGVEDGSIICLVAIPVHPARCWTTRSAGEMRMLEVTGMLSRAWLDAASALENVP